MNLVLFDCNSGGNLGNDDIKLYVNGGWDECGVKYLLLFELRD